MAVKADEYIRIDRTLQLAMNRKPATTAGTRISNRLRRSIRARSSAWKPGMPLTDS